MFNCFIKDTESMGRGVFSSRPIPKNNEIALCEILVLSPQDTIKVNQTDLKCYTFKYSEDQDCLVLDQGEMFNHSETPNVGYRLIKDEGRSKMLFYSLRELTQGEQLFIDYNADVSIRISEYCLNLIK